MGSYLWWAVAAVNVVALGAMGVDKLKAIRAARRIPEAHLLLLALFTGAPGIWTGSALFRHKTVKSSFRRKLVLATLGNGLWLWLYFGVR